MTFAVADSCFYDHISWPVDASEKDIRERFKHLAKKWHPDKNLENPKEAEEV